jgi:phosphohistidine phosphatase SixA
VAVTAFYLVRHGETTGGPGDPGLAETGRSQASAVAAQLATHSIAAVYASPLRRARETAAVIAAGVGCDVEIDERLRERANLLERNSDLGSLRWCSVTELRYDGANATVDFLAHSRDG